MLRVTPAMEATLPKNGMNIEDIVRMVVDAKPNRQVTY
jgi:hypothetical protein